MNHVCKNSLFRTLFHNLARVGKTSSKLHALKREGEGENERENFGENLKEKTRREKTRSGDLP
jgi:hypothetical protein